ncbi:hypothetical protein G6F50_014309 [Rhizopus delemar]|uniref:Uncharacterized protein n=1 Tax=Rhizopus delemar TaxID=936053 RepID=A0A9P6Y7D9_9FUNG|nr:hypothetical protein G6F50_014309 [Rhizopus delemar]
MRRIGIRRRRHDLALRQLRMGGIQQVLEAARRRRHPQQQGVAARQPGIADRPGHGQVGLPVQGRIGIADGMVRRHHLQQEIVAGQRPRMPHLRQGQPREHGRCRVRVQHHHRRAGAMPAARRPGPRLQVLAIAQAPQRNHGPFPSSILTSHCSIIPACRPC